MPTPWRWAQLTWSWAKPLPRALALLPAAQVLPRVQVVQPVGPLPVPLLAQVQPQLAQQQVLAQWLLAQVLQFPLALCWPAWSV